MPKISVIIPVYNVEKYLRECLNSIINQTYKNLEIICVDDCSNDKSVQILKEYAQKDNRIKIIHHDKNKGLAISRNTGLDNSSGDYIFFLDSDDYIIEDCIKNLYDNIIRTKVDIAVTRTVAFADDSSKETIERTQNMNTWLNRYCQDNYQVNIYNFANTLDTHNCVSWGKLYTRSFLVDNNLRFINKNCVLEDTGYWVKTCACFPSITYVEKIGLMYRIRLGAITSYIHKREMRHKRHKHRLDVLNDALKFIDNNINVEYKQLLKVQLLSGYGNIIAVKCYLFGLLKIIWLPDKKHIRILGIPIFAEKQSNVNEKRGRIFGISVYKTKLTFFKKAFCLTFNIKNFMKKEYRKENIIVKTNNNDENIKQAINNIEPFFYYPNKGNVGDVLISCAVFQYIENYNYKVFDVTKFNKLKKTFNLLYGGGRIWTKNYQEDYQNILNVFKSPLLRKCVILPSSFKDCSDLMHILDHRFTVFCREKESYQYCMENNKKAKFILADDMVINANFNIFNTNFYNCENLKQFLNKGEKYIKRVIENDYTFYENARLKVEQNLLLCNNIGFMLRTDFEKAVNLDISNSFDLSNILSSYCCDEGLCYLVGKLFLYAINQFDVIVTDRLHIGLCGTKLGKEVFLLDNSYKKISSVYNFSLKNWSNVHLTNENNLQNDLDNYKKKMRITQKTNITLPQNVEEFLISYGSFKNKYRIEKEA